MNSSKFLYWLAPKDFEWTQSALIKEGFQLKRAVLTPCQVLRTSGHTVVYADPRVWNLLCVRQGSWYRSSKCAGQYMLMSEKKLPESFDKFLDAELAESSFMPERLPTDSELQKLVDSDAYQKNKPKEWESIWFKDSILFRVFFTLTGFWGWGDNLKTFWLSHRANHANFLAHHFTTERDGASVPYSVTENAGVCSSCAEFFNVVDDSSRKLVRACPGSVAFGGAKRDIYIDVKPTQSCDTHRSTIP